MKSSQVAGFSMADCLQERRDIQRQRELHDKRVQFAIQKGKENGQRLLEQLLDGRSHLDFKCPTEASDKDFKAWQNDCRDVISAAATYMQNNGVRFAWNGDWRETGYLTIGLLVIRRKAA